MLQWLSIKSDFWIFQMHSNVKRKWTGSTKITLMLLKNLLFARIDLIERIEFIPMLLLAKLLFYHSIPIIILKYIGRELKMPRYPCLDLSKRGKI